MKRRVISLCLLLLVLLCPLIVFAQEEELPEIHFSDGEEELTPAGELAVRRIQDSIQGVRKRAGRKTFVGYCGKYVNNMLVYYGINRQYISGDGNQAFDNYKNKTVTGGGYHVEALSYKDYTLREALEKLIAEHYIPQNLLIGFHKGRSSKGQRFGHALFVDSIIDGKIYFSESHKIEYTEGEIIPEGTVLIWSVEDFCAYYDVCKFEGIIRFFAPPMPSPTFREWDNDSIVQPRREKEETYNSNMVIAMCQ